MRLANSLYALITLCLLAGMLESALAAQAKVSAVRTWAGPDHTRLVLDLDRPVSHDIFLLDNPPRLVLDVPNARSTGSMPRPAEFGDTISRLRSGVRNGRDLRLVLDLTAEVKPRSFVLPPQDGQGPRLVVDLLPRRPAAAPAPVVVPVPVAVPRRVPTPTAGELVVAIDAGHGGKDPGAIGKGGTREKDITLAIARQLAVLVAREPNMRPLLIRESDYFVTLRGRTIKAREAQADLFVSIHADAVPHGNAAGASVYVLSTSGASNEAARWLAARENAADLVGGVTLEDRDPVIQTVLLDLFQSSTIDASFELGEAVLQRLGPLGGLHKASVQQAGFAVLKSPDIPSILVETAFISNRREEQRLRDPGHQRRIAAAVLEGIRSYATNRRPDVMLAARP